MWILIFWLSTPFSGSLNMARQSTLVVHSRESDSERACKDAPPAMNKVNVDELTLHGVRISKDEQGVRR